MSIVINTNIQSIFAQRALSKNTLMLGKSTERLSTGFRINRAADDAAGLSISEKLTSQIKGLAQAEKNIGDGISLLQTAEGGLAIVHDNLQRIRELMVQAANGTNNEDELNALQREINERIRTIDDISDQTSFNGTDLLDGANDITLQTGYEAADNTLLQFAVDTAGPTLGEGIRIEVDFATVGTTSSNHAGNITEGVDLALNTLSLATTGMTNPPLSVYALDSAVTTQEQTFTLGDMDTMIENVSRMRSYIGAVQNSLESKLEFLQISGENAQASRSRIRDVDVASESSELLKSQILQQSAAGMLSQANQSPQLALDLLP